MTTAMTMPATTTAMPPSSPALRSSADRLRVVLSQLALRGPNRACSSANVYVPLATWPAPLPVPRTDTSRLSKRWCNRCHTTLATFRTSDWVGGAATATCAVTRPPEPPKLKCTLTD
jgi:hypothetical protein